jgi:hypothetical protein
MTTFTVSIWHNVARDHAGRHTAPLDGYRPGDPMVRVFTYQATAGGRVPEAIAEEAFAGQRAPQRSRRRGTVPPVLQEAAALTVVPRKFFVLQEVVLASPSQGVAVSVAPQSAGRGLLGWAQRDHSRARCSGMR